MSNGSERSDKSDLAWILVVILALLLVLGLPAVYVWRTVEMQRMRAEVEDMRMMEQKARQEAEQARDEARRRAEAERKARLQAEQQRQQKKER
jgi:Tfp pilus assembly protein PilX